MLHSIPPTAQASSAVRDHTPGSLDRVGLDAPAGTSTHRTETPEVFRPQPTRFIQSEAQRDIADSFEDSNAAALSPQLAMGQTREDSHDTRHEVGNRTEVCADSQSGPDLDSPTRLVGHVSPPLPLPLEVREEEYNDKDNAIDDDSARPLAQQLRRKRTRRSNSRIQQQTASNCDFDADNSSSSGSEDAVLEDEDYCPSPGASGQEQASYHSIDEAGHKPEGFILAPPHKRRKMGRPQRSSKPYRRSSRLTAPPNMANPSGLHTPVHSPRSMSSQDSVTTANAKAPAAKYEEWPVQGATLKRLTMDGRVTFQLEFSWELCAGGHSPGSQNSSRSKPHIEEKISRTQRSSAAHAFAREEDDLIVKLKDAGLPWPEIHKQFSNEFPQRRSQGSLQVRYSTKLKTRNKQAIRKSNRG